MTFKEPLKVALFFSLASLVLQPHVKKYYKFFISFLFFHKFIRCNHCMHLACRIICILDETVFQENISSFSKIYKKLMVCPFYLTPQQFSQLSASCLLIAAFQSSVISALSLMRAGDSDDEPMSLGFFFQKTIFQIILGKLFHFIIVSKELKNSLS